MNLLNKRFFSVLTLGVFAGGFAAVAQGCDELGDLAEQCGLECPAEGILDGNAQISGIVQVDAFFGAVVDVSAAANGITTEVRAKLDAMGASLGLPSGSTGAEVKAALQAKLDANVSGGLKVNYEPPACSASVDVAVSAAAECDVDVDPGELSVECSGSCQAEAGVEVDCGAEANLTCTGTAPDLECSGSCTGSCNLTVAAACEGTCNGTCDGTCSVKNAAGECAGECEGNCEGECKLEAGGECSGKCEGSCEYTPPDGKCEATASAHCEAEANASVECEGSCEGTAKPPSVSADCTATVEAKADASVECVPPALSVSWQWSAALEADVQAQAEFKAWLEGFKTQFSAMLAMEVKGKLLVDAFANMTAAADGAVKGAADVALDGDFKAKIGAGCAIAALPDAKAAIKTSLKGLSVSVSAVAEISAVVKG